MLQLLQAHYLVEAVRHREAEPSHCRVHCSSQVWCSLVGGMTCWNIAMARSHVVNCSQCEPVHPGIFIKIRKFPLCNTVMLTKYVFYSASSTGCSQVIHGFRDHFPRATGLHMLFFAVRLFTCKCMQVIPWPSG